MCKTYGEHDKHRQSGRPKKLKCHYRSRYEIGIKIHEKEENILVNYETDWYDSGECGATGSSKHGYEILDFIRGG